jgi:hypothetical protein
MKIFLTAISLLIGALLFGAEKEVDPFAYVPPKKADRTEDKGSVDFISDDILKALKEVRLDKGTGKGGPGIIRITILRSFHSPMVFTWFPATEKQEPSLHVKRIMMKTDANGIRVYSGLDINKHIKLRSSQDKNLKTHFGNANFDGLGQDCWQGAGLDGSIWVYERAAEDGYTLIARNNPINPQSAVDHSTISKKQLLQESNLTIFALMIWTLSDIDDESIY